MSAKINTAKIGLFVILAVLLFIAGLLAFGAKSYFVQKTRVETAIPGEVYGLSVGSGVQLRGVPIGKVTEICFAWNTYPHSRSNLIVVDFEVESPLLPLPPGMTLKQAVKEASGRGLRAMVKSQGITGTSVLALESLDPQAYPPPAIDYEPRHPYVPSAPPQLTRLVESLDKSLRHLQELDFGSIGREVTNTLTAAQGLVTKLGDVDFKGLSGHANDLLVQLKVGSSNLTATLSEVQSSVRNAQLASVGTNANALLADLRGSNVKLQAVLDKLGNAPLQQTVAELEQALGSLNEVLVELKTYPSGFLFGKPPEPVRGVQTMSK